MTTQPERAIRSILVCGSGVVGWSAALAFARTLPQAKISLLALPDHPAALADRMPTSLPSIGAFHSLTGIDELDLVKRGAAVHHLGTQFEGWSADRSGWIHAHGQYGIPEWPVVFHDLWARAAKEGRALPYHCYSPAGVMTAAGKFVHPGQGGRWPFSTYRYGLRLDPSAYRAVLEQSATSAGVAQLSGQLRAVEPRDGNMIAAIQLDGGRRIEADLFVDCSGPDSLLLREVDATFEGWEELFPFDQLSFAWGPAAVSPAESLVATSAGWVATLPLAQRTLIVTAAGGDEGHREADAIAVRYGRRPRPWVGNILAIGDAAAAIDPLHGINLHLAHSAILRALELLPGRDCHPLELKEYNRRTDLELSRARDFIALHYLRSGRSDSEGWRRAAATKAPDSLAHTLDQFEYRGRLPFYEQESFTADSWSAVLLGLGILPRFPDAVAGKYPMSESLASMEQLAERLRKLPEQLPPYPEYLDRMATSPRPRASGLTSSPSAS